MSKRLILMRHAKSDWFDPTLPDRERPLNPRGRASATALGKWLGSQGYVPDEVLCSAATRTRETFDRLALSVPVTLSEGLYLAPAEVMLQTLRGCQTDTVLMIGHNPGIGHLAQEIVTHPADHGRFADYPTGATLVCDLPITTWADAVLRSAQVVDFIVPRDLETG